jgi:hypothetical protein
MEKEFTPIIRSNIKVIKNRYRILVNIRMVQQNKSY